MSDRDSQVRRNPLTDVDNPLPRTLSASALPRSDVGLLRGLAGVPIEQMQHEPGCQCGSEPSAEPAPRDVDDLWQLAVAIAGSVRGALQPPPTVAVVMPEVCLRSGSD